MGNYTVRSYATSPIFDGVIKTLVSKNLYINPTIAHHWWTWGVQIPNSKQYAHEVIDFAKANDAALAWVPANVVRKSLQTGSVKAKPFGSAANFHKSCDNYATVT